MNNILSAELQKLIEQEAHDSASSLYSPNNYNEFTSYQSGHQKGAALYALKWEQAE